MTASVKRRFPPSVIRTEADMWTAGARRAEIAAAAGIQAQDVDAIRKRLGLAPRRVRANQFRRTARMKETQPRACLKCRQAFPSEGAHNRVCGECKHSAEWRSGGDRTVAIPAVRPHRTP